MKKMTNVEFREQTQKRLFGWSTRLVVHLRKLSKQNDKAIWIIADQLMRSGTSIGANYNEGIACQTAKDFRYFLSISLKSANESVYWLELLKSTKIDDSEELSWLTKEAKEFVLLLGKSVATLYGTKYSRS